jgi:S1-C subfamily serine protease
MILDIEQDGPAAKADLMKGDVILDFAGEPVTGVDDLHRLLTAERARSHAELRIMRAGRLRSFSIRPEADG